MEQLLLAKIAELSERVAVLETRREVYLKLVPSARQLIKVHAMVNRQLERTPHLKSAWWSLAEELGKAVAELRAVMPSELLEEP